MTRHEVEDWEPVASDSGLVFQYRCRRCGTLIDSAVVLVGEAQEQEYREQLPRRLILGVFSRDLVEMGDGRQYARLTGVPVCTVPRAELEAS